MPPDLNDTDLNDTDLNDDDFEGPTAAVELRTALRNCPTEVGRARHLVGDHLGRWGVQDDDGVAVLLVSELVTNALRYGIQPMRMVARRADGSLRVEIHDARTGEAPRVARPEPESTSGRGMMIVDALATRWGCIEFGGSKNVWFELDVPTRSDGPYLTRYV